MRRRFNISGGLTSQATHELQFTVGGDGDTVTKYVVDYFKDAYGFSIQHVHWSCLQLGRTHKKNYMPTEVCKIVSGQRYSRKLNERQVTQVEGRVLEPPKLKVGNGGDLFPRGGHICRAETDHALGCFESLCTLRHQYPMQRSNEVCGSEDASWKMGSLHSAFYLGMDLSHGSRGRSDVPSIAAVVSSRKWPLISWYRASVRSQSARVEMIDALFKPVSAVEDDGMIRELLMDFYQSTPKLKPDHIIIFRYDNGVSESQFEQVLNIELEQIMQKTHHTRFFQPRSDANVPAGYVPDSRKHYDQCD
ncbi:putative post-transcriptional gene silencing PAZ-Argonaute family [Helianthus anomalus]